MKCFKIVICCDKKISDKVMTYSLIKTLLLKSKNYFFFAFTRLINRAGSNIRFVHVAVTSVNEVSHPNAWVPPNPLKLKIINPAISTNDV